MFVWAALWLSVWIRPSGGPWYLLLCVTGQNAGLLRNMFLFICLFCFYRIAGWWSLCGGVVTTATLNTYRPNLGWIWAMQSWDAKPWTIIGPCSQNQPAHGVTSEGSALEDTRKEKEREPLRRKVEDWSSDNQRDKSKETRTHRADTLLLPGL